MNLLPGSSSEAFAQFGDCGRVLVTLPGASSPRSRAEEELKKEDNNESRKTAGSVQNFAHIR